MITLPPVAITGGPDSVNLTVNDGCCALIQNESGYALEVAVGQTKRWLGAWVADLFDIPSGVSRISWAPQLVGSLVNAPSSVLLVTVAEPGEGFRGMYPMALTRQAGVNAGNVNVGNQAAPSPVMPQNGSGTPLGDTSALALVADKLTDTITPSPGPLNAAFGAIASFKASGAPALVGSAGALKTGNNTQVAPAFGQATVAGHLLVAWVSCGTSDKPTTPAAGWTEAVHSDQSQGNCVALWFKANCGAAEAAPVFSAAASSTPMYAQLAEFSGIATASPLDQTGTIIPGAVNALAPVCGAADAAGQDLILMIGRWVLNTSSTATFSQTVNNGATVAHAGDTGATSGVRQVSHDYAINPASTPNLPLGTAPWDCDAQGSSSPAAGTVASVVLAATAGKKYRAHFLSASIGQSGATAQNAQAQLKDGGGVIHSRQLFINATAQTTQGFEIAGAALPGTTGNSMTMAFSAVVATVAQVVTIGAYLR